MRFVLYLFLLFTELVAISQVVAQGEQTRRLYELGLEAQWYPAGIIGSFRGAKYVSDKSALIAGIGYNDANRRDFGEHDLEKGGGPGLYAGYRRYFFTDQPSGLYASARLTGWWMAIGWKDERNGEIESGTTFITVLQPTLDVGYELVLNKSWSIAAGGAFGIEWNVISFGEDVGQGGISILFLSAGRRF